NFSPDTPDPGRFRELTRRDGLDRVLAGLAAAKRAGFDPIKVNAVAIRGFTDTDAVPLARFCREHGLELRFIEYMPIGADAWEREKVFFAHEILELLGREVAPLAPAADADPHANDEFDPPDETDPLVRELRTEILRLQAQLDQIQAATRAWAAEQEAVRAEMETLHRRMTELEARRRRHERRLWVQGLIC